MTYKDEMTFQSYIYDVSDNGRVITVLKSLPQKPFESKVLCLWGDNSSGKTHLLHAVKYLHSNNMRVEYTTSDRFILLLARAIEENTVRNFEEFYDKVDILLFDDAQFLIGKYALEFLKKRIVPRIHCYVLLALDFEPHTIGILDKDEVVLKLVAPNISVRQQIVRKISNELQLQLDEALQLLVAEKISDVRRISGFLTYLKANMQDTSTCC